MSSGTEDRTIDRRQLLRRAAATGAAVAWATPVVRSLSGTPAFAATGSPQDLSYVAFCYSPGDTRRCCVKIEVSDTKSVEGCEANNFQTPQCGFSGLTSDSSCGDCGLFDVSFPGTGAQIVTISFKSSVPAEYAFAGDTVAIGKCGNPESPTSGGECVNGYVSNGGRTLTFDMCGA